MTVFEIVPLLISGGAATWGGTAVLQWLKTRGEIGQTRIDAEADLEKHRDGLTFQLLAAARSELAAMRDEIVKLRPLEIHLYELEQALEHIEAMLSADADGRKVAERNARAFVNRIRRMATARGEIANEIQRVDSALATAERVRTPPAPRPDDRIAIDRAVDRLGNDDQEDTR